jgi:polysaccharide export outer membrane protein
MIRSHVPRPRPRGGHSPKVHRGAALAVLLAGLAAVAGCHRGTSSIRVEDLPRPPPADPEYRIGTGDVLGVRVWNQEAMSLAHARVRDDGRVSIPFLQDVEVAGTTPAELSKRLQAQLKSYVVNPVVTVTVEESRPSRVSVLGEVTRPGIYELDRDAVVLVALAAAGGLSEHASRDEIYVLRSEHGREAAPLRIRFRWQDLARGERPAATFRLRTGDTVVVE